MEGLGRGCTSKLFAKQLELALIVGARKLLRHLTPCRRVEALFSLLNRLFDKAWSPKCAKQALRIEQQWLWTKRIERYCFAVQEMRLIVVPGTGFYFTQVVQQEPQRFDVSLGSRLGDEVAKASSRSCVVTPRCRKNGCKVLGEASEIHWSALTFDMRG